MMFRLAVEAYHSVRELRLLRRQSRDARRDVKSVFSPNFYFGSHMKNEFRSGAVSQGIVSGGSVALSGLVASLSRLVTGLQGLVSSLQASSNSKK
jgi:hypothetical protein